VNRKVISPEGEAPEREDFRAVVLKGRLAEAVGRLNPKLPADAVAEVVHVVLTPEHPSLVEAARNRLADLELEFGFEKSKVDAIRSKLFGALPTYYQERDRLRVLVNFRKAFIERLLAECEEAAEATTGDYQREGICDLLFVFPQAAGGTPNTVRLSNNLEQSNHRLTGYSQMKEG